jgi:hypothetical protein
METGREKTMAMTRAIKELISVPTRKAKAPNSPRTGSQVLPIRKLKPNWRRAGSDAITSEKKIAKRRITKLRAAR